jgi:hypothetical protein
MAVGAKLSCRPLVELEQSTEPLIAFPLVRAFEMVMRDKLSDYTAQRRFAEEDQLR